MTKKHKLWAIGWTIVYLFTAILLFFVKANYQIELIGESAAFNFSKVKGDIVLEDGKNTFSVAHASQIIVRELDTIFVGSDYNAHFKAKTIRFKNIRITNGAEIKISALENTLVLSMSNVELGALFQLGDFQSISVRDNTKDTLIHIERPLPFETASVSAKRSAIDYQTSLYFNDGYILKITNLHDPELDFSQSMPGEGYTNSLYYLKIPGRTNEQYQAISSHAIRFKHIDQLEIQCKNGSIKFRIFGIIKKLGINGKDVRESLYEHYIEPSGLGKLVELLAWLLAWLLPWILPFVFK